ncbi:MAG TPA: V-type ATPase subunit subunit G family protein [Methanolinea sp.]|nr:V-type ATPase subunit subunit G family protein [Methanolinea sp.]HQK55945.1 V-type ATPase subunit subunit G family protein [Methanolinea sp.]
MITEKSLLQKIREKELEMSVKIDEARNLADQHLSRVKKESLAILKQGEEEGRTAAEDLVKKEMERVRGEINVLRAKTEEEIQGIRTRGEANLRPAVDRIVSLILAE